MVRYLPVTELCGFARFARDQGTQGAFRPRTLWNLLALSQALADPRCSQCLSQATMSLTIIFTGPQRELIVSRNLSFDLELNMQALCQDCMHLRGRRSHPHVLTPP